MLYFSQLLPIEELSVLMTEYHAGLELIDFSIGMNLDRLTPYIRKWEKKLIRLHHPPFTIHGPFLDLNPMSFEPLNAQAAWLRFSQAYEAARCLGADRIIYHTCRIPVVCYLEGWATRLADFWNRFLEQHREVPVSIENVFDESPYALAEFAAQVQAENFSLCLDVGHAGHASSLAPEIWLDILSPWIEHLHLHDNHGVRDEHLALGKGSIRLERVLSGISTLPRKTSVTLEHATKEEIRISMEYLENINLF